MEKQDSVEIGQYGEQLGFRVPHRKIDVFFQLIQLIANIFHKKWRLLLMS